VERYKLEEVMSGHEADCLWITLGFSSGLCANDVLHIVRTGGAEHIAATPLSVQVRLNEKGRDALGFADTEVWFDASNNLAKYGEALEILQKMIEL
jgi:hypothetical protein